MCTRMAQNVEKFEKKGFILQEIEYHKKLPLYKKSVRWQSKGVAGIKKKSMRNVRTEFVI
jgi:hypothetical protein